jgi:hypothetical protein
METILTPDEIFQLITTGMVNLTDDLIIRLAESSARYTIQSRRERTHTSRLDSHIHI